MVGVVVMLFSLITFYLMVYTTLQYQSMNGKDSLFPEKVYIAQMN